MLYLVMGLGSAAGFAVGYWVADPDWSFRIRLLQRRRIVRPVRYRHAWEIPELYDADRYRVNEVE